MTGAQAGTRDAAAESSAVTLLLYVRGTAGDAAHVAAALRAYVRAERVMGTRAPASLTALEEVFAAVAMRSREVTGGQRGPEVGRPRESVERVPRDDHSTPELLSREQAARRLNCSPSTLKRREQAGHLHAVRHGRVVRYRLTDLDQLGDTR